MKKKKSSKNTLQEKPKFKTYSQLHANKIPVSEDMSLIDEIYGDVKNESIEE